MTTEEIDEISAKENPTQEDVRKLVAAIDEAWGEATLVVKSHRKMVKKYGDLLKTHIAMQEELIGILQSQNSTICPQHPTVCAQRPVRQRGSLRRALEMDASKIS